MDVFKLVTIAIIAASLALVVRSYRPELSLQISMIAGIMILLFVIAQIGGVIESIQVLAERYGIQLEYIGVLIKIIGIAYIAQFAVLVCRDAGETALSSKVELAGRVMILAAALPAAVGLLEMVAALLPASNTL